MDLAGGVDGRRAIRGETALYKTARKDLAEDLRQLLLGLVDQARGKTFGHLAADWFARIEKRRVWPANERGHLKHMRPLMHMHEGELTKGAIDDLFGRLLKPHGPLGPASVNKLRSSGRLIIRDAQGNGEWGSVNPFDLVRPMRTPKPLYDTLTADEAALVLAHLREDRRRMAKTILLVGIRPGEAMALRKCDVDLERRVMTVRRSHGRNQTKTGTERAFPIPDALVDDLRAAVAASPSDLVFPRPDGTRQRQDTKLARVLRTALKAAGLVTGYRYHCRRKGCGFKDELEASVDLQCPWCSMRLWCEPIPRALRFYDLRHSASTLHRKAKCDPLVIQEMLGHSPGNTTDSTYTHLDEQYRREQLNKLKIEGDD